MYKKNMLYAALIIFSYILPNSAFASNWQNWINDLRPEAIANGVDESLFDEIYKNLLPDRRLMRLATTQPEKRLTFKQYRSTRVDPYRIKIGKKAYKKNKTLLHQVAADFKVNPCIITAIWGMETSYGHFMGSFNVIRSLSTLAFYGKRTKFFRKELLVALGIVNDGHIAVEDYVGEWAGASGQSQFLPSSWINYAVDYDGDGQKDIWKTKGDVFASIANYIHKNGWRENEPWSYEVKVNSEIPQQNLGLETNLTLDYWQNKEVIPVNKVKIYEQPIQASLIYPDGGPYFLVFNNFKTIMKYNRSI